MFVYHVSKKLNKDMVFFPRVPRSRMMGENSTIPRICVAMNIIDALRGYNCFDIDDEFNVFRFEIKDNDCFIKWNKIAKFVVDSCWTHECWLLNKKRGKKIGRIKVKDFDFGSSTNEFGEVFSAPVNIKWKWIEKYS